MEILGKLDKLINCDSIKNKCVTASDLLNEHEKYCKDEGVCTSDISCTECFAIFAIDNFNIERK